MTEAALFEGMGIFHLRQIADIYLLKQTKTRREKATIRLPILPWALQREHIKTASEEIRMDKKDKKRKRKKELKICISVVHDNQLKC